MRLFIAEKPSLGKVIAETIGIEKRFGNYIKCKENTVVTWCFGHILELVKPNYYLKNEKKAWDLEDLPIIPDNWKRTVKKDSYSQYKTIKKLVEQADEIINAGDPDREGQLLVDEVIEYVGCKKPVKRIWLQALDKQNVRKALSKLEDNSKYLKFKQSAEARSYADWLVGLNLTRYFTVKAGSLITIGRVQTPTLALIVNRDESIEHFKPHNYYVITANLDKAFKATYKPDNDSQGLDESGRLIDKNIADSIVRATTNKQAIVTDYKKTSKTEYPPMPFMLSSLQKYANSKYGFTAKETLSIAQSLYEKKLTTYPRTDCRYIAEEQFNDAKNIVESIGKMGLMSNLVKSADFSIKHKAYNSKKITAHTAIVPTGDTKAVSSLNNAEMKIYLDIVKVFMCLFQKPHKYYAIQVTLDIEGYKFIATGRDTINQGFKEYCISSTSTSNISMPVLVKGHAILNKQTTVEIKKTTPLPYFTDGTLVDAMSHIHKYIDNQAAKTVLKENDGIGTEATRAMIIEQLVKKGYLKRKGKNIVSTAIAREFIKELPDFIKDPILTAEWERELSNIIAGKTSFNDFMNRQKEFIREHINKQYSIKQISQPQNNAYGKKKKSGKKCPNCDNIMAKLKTKTGKNYYWCGKCKTAYWVDAGGKVGEQWNFPRTNKKQMRK